MPIGSTLTLDYPTADDNFSVYAAKIKAALEVFEEILEQKIDAGSLQLTTPVSFGGSYAYNLLRVVLSVAGVSPTTVGSLYVDSDGELHIVTPDGDVRITANGSIDVTALGTIGGDYGGSNPASVTFNDISGEYRFNEDTDDWAVLVASALKLKQDGAGTGSLTVGLDASVTVPLVFNIMSLPASGVGGLAYSHADQAVVDATVVRETVKHLFTDIDVSGNVNHTTRTLTMEPGRDGIAAFTMSDAYGAWWFGINGIPAGSRLTRVKVLHSKTTTGSSSFTVKAKNGVTFTSESSAVTSVVSGNQETIINLTGSGYTLVDEDVMGLYVVPPAGVTADIILSITAMYDRGQ